MFMYVCVCTCAYLYVCYAVPPHSECGMCLFGHSKSDTNIIPLIFRIVMETNFSKIPTNQVPHKDLLLTTIRLLRIK